MSDKVFREIIDTLEIVINSAEKVGSEPKDYWHGVSDGLRMGVNIIFGCLDEKEEL